MRRLLLAVVLVALGGIGYAYSASTTPTVTVAPIKVSASTLARGEYLLCAGGCINCHQTQDSSEFKLSGGLPLETPFGMYFVPNITPDPETGIISGKRA